MQETIIKKETLEELRKKVKFRDRGIFEKAVYAFNLLDGMLKHYPDLIFKGGTSILLHIFPPIRFSIDIDIILNPKDKYSLEGNLKKAASESGFYDVAEDMRDNKKNIPKNILNFIINLIMPGLNNISFWI
ncbi:MAG: nucleotidyl transferase AbiEii/AbiGii toxin family protein [Candidatus Omnitrophica bacterium]|nr:nucleotidyl transferase AbiEii/AbiGii toxin family protein [Candidatus Omnitrophota bacterium]